MGIINKFTDDDKGLGKPNKKSKDWVIEYKWKSLEDFNKYPSYFFKEEYDENWKKLSFGSRFNTVKGAKEALKNRMKYLQQPKDGFWYRHYQGDLGKDFRIRNEKTNDIIYD